MRMDFIPTRAAVRDKNDFKLVSYEAHKPKVKQNSVETMPSKNEVSNAFNIKQAKHEVFKLGMSTLDSKKKREAKIELAIKLGAKPPRNKYKNYKQLQMERKKDKEREAKKAQFQQLGKTNTGKSNAKGKSFDKKRKLKANNDILNKYGKVRVGTK